MQTNPHRSPIQLSVCVIGKNEGRHLPACAASLAQLAAAGIAYESIFVDSASTDGSVDIAIGLFDRVVSLVASPFLNAGAARRIGTEHAAGDWVLYMDGDMELAPEVLQPICSLIKSGDLARGLCAFTENLFPDGTRSLIQFRGNHDGAPCRMFGGAVLLPRQKVCEAGNWSAHLYAYEEAELNARLGGAGVAVIWHDCRMVIHKTPQVPFLRKLVGAVVPYRSYLGKKFYGAGQVTLLTLQNGHFLRFAQRKPEAYAMLAAWLIMLGAWPLAGAYSALPLLIVFVTNLVRSGPRAAVNYACFQVQVVFGMFKLHREFTPGIAQVFTGRPPRGLATGAIG